MINIEKVRYLSVKKEVELACHSFFAVYSSLFAGSMLVKETNEGYSDSRQAVKQYQTTVAISDSVIFHMCATVNLKGRLLHPDTKSKSSFLSDGFRNWKIALCQTKGFCKDQTPLCHKHATGVEGASQESKVGM